MSKSLINRSIQCLIRITCLGLLEIPPLLAQTGKCSINFEEKILICANVYDRKYNFFTPKPYLQTEEPLETDNEQARLQFNEGSIARMGANSQFYFAGGQNFGEVTEGEALVALLENAPPIDTPNTNIVHSTTVYILTYDSKNDESLIRVLGGELTVSNRDGSQSVDLKAGQLLVVDQDFVGSPQSFDLEAFYQDKDNPESELAEGFGPGQEDSIPQQPRSVRDAMYLLRTDTLIAVRSQTRTFPSPDFRRSFLNDALAGISDPLEGRGPNDSYINTQRPAGDPDSPISAILRVEATVEGTSGSIVFPGQLTEDGNFSFITPRLEGIVEGVNLGDLPSADISFDVGTRDLTINAPILTTQRFINAVLSNPVVLRVVSEQLNFDLSTATRDEALAIIQSATVTPQGVPIPATTDAGTFIPVIRDSGPIFIGPILDR